MQFAGTVFDALPEWSRLAPSVAGAVVGVHLGKFRDLILHGPPEFRKFARSLFNHHSWSGTPLAEKMKPATSN
jgi:hypothetical protein